MYQQSSNRFKPLVRTFGAAMLLLGLVMLGTALVSGGSTARADPPDTPPGQDPCSHGNSNRPCRDDPQPLHGKDCEYHGQRGGMNEDHCQVGSVSIDTPTAIPNTPVPTSTSAAVIPTPTTQTEAISTPTTVAVLPAGETPVAAGAVVSGLPPAAPVQVAEVRSSQAQALGVTELPRTGSGGQHQSQTALFAGMVLILAGGMISLTAMRIR